MNKNIQLEANIMIKEDLETHQTPNNYISCTEASWRKP